MVAEPPLDGGRMTVEMYRRSYKIVSLHTHQSDCRCGKIVYAYAMAPFLALRCFEQIKIGIAYHNANVIIVGTGSGLSYAELGPTHHSLEDI